jgi:hypothetical protein
VDDGQADQQAAVVALVLAHLRHDEQAVNAMLATTDTVALFAATTGLLCGWISQQVPGGLAALHAYLSDWQDEHRDRLFWQSRPW